ncbi:MAG: hypothetical protein Q9213_002479 [Squamulea squamosa]
MPETFTRATFTPEQSAHLCESFTEEELQRVSDNFSREELQEAVRQQGNTRVPSSETLIDEHSTDGDVSAATDSLVTCPMSDDLRYVSSGPGHPPPLCVSISRSSSMKQTDGPRSTHQKPQQHRIRFGQLSQDTSTHQHAPETFRESKTQRQGQRSRGQGRRAHPLSQLSKVSKTSDRVDKANSTRRRPTQEERQEARGEVRRLSAELYGRWHPRGETQEIKKAIKHQQDIANGGYIVPADEQVLLMKEKRKRSEDSIKASARRDDDNDDDNHKKGKIDMFGYFPGEKSRTLKRMRGQAAVKEEEEIDEKGNFLYNNSATAPASGSGQYKDIDERDYDDAEEGSGDGLGADHDDTDYSPEDSDDEPMPPPKKRRSGQSGSFHRL